MCGSETKFQAQIFWDKSRKIFILEASNKQQIYQEQRDEEKKRGKEEKDKRMNDNNGKQKMYQISS